VPSEMAGDPAGTEMAGDPAGTEMAGDPADRYRDGLIPGDGGGPRGAEDMMIAEHMIGEPVRAAAQRHDGVKPVRLRSAPSS
jgi:hypothetical protein